MKERRRELSREERYDTQLSITDRHIRFRVGDSQHFAIPYRFVLELIRTTQLTAVPGTPGFVAGVVNRRGKLLMVIDLSYFFRVPKVTDDRDSQILIIRHNDVEVGILTTAAETDEAYRPTDLSPPLPSPGAKELAYVQGIANGSVTVLDIEAMFGSGHLDVGTPSGDGTQQSGETP